MRICIVGAGAIGGFLGVRLAVAGHDVSLIARGAHLAAIRAHGVHLVMSGATTVVSLAASDNPADLGRQDYVILTLKAPSLPSLVPRLGPLLGGETTVVTAMNGLPWWFYNGIGGPLEVEPLDAVDPDGGLAAAVDPASIVGCVVHAGASVPEPGVVRHAAGDHFIFGEPSHVVTARVRALAAAVTDAGLRGEASDNIHREIWLKLLGNLSMGTISVLTGATLRNIGDDRNLRAAAAMLLDECRAVGARFGLTLAMTNDARIDLGAALGHFRPSILQDLEAGRPMEIDAVITVVAELGRRAGVVTPVLDMVLALVQGRARLAGLYP
ncbi:MAG: 2-dehydropantoate 2-reductase [Alphaproteobacteria bacterium]|nr:2-dehydropantoate 2-reductase [Alphaproteobacteria bacterium]